MRKPTVLIAVPVLAAALFWSGFQTARDDDFYAMRKNFELFGSVYEEIVGSYMTRVDPERFMRTGMDAMLQTLDPWTDFLDEADNVAMEMRGQSGLGEVPVNLGSKGGRVTVLAPDALTGAYLQGVRTGDVIHSVDGEVADSLSVVQVRELLRGEPDTTVPVIVDRAGDGQLEFQLKREPPVISFVSTTMRIEGTDLALVKLDAFGPGAAFEIDSALEDLHEERPIEGVVLDLRGNPGGLVNEAIKLVGLFVPKATPVVSTRGRSPESNRLYANQDEPDWLEMPLVVLVDRASASASEIVSGALQDLDRAVVVGQPSFGKGLVQVVRPLPYHTAVKLTYSRYFTPSGRGIRKDALEEGAEPMQTFRTRRGREVREGNGIEPDVALPMPDAGPLEQALLREAAFFRFAGVLVQAEGDAIRAATSASGRLELPDDALDRFALWLDAEGFALTTSFDEALAELQAVAPESATGQLTELRALASRQTDEALAEEAPALLARLADEVGARLLDPNERSRLQMRSDASMLEAVSVLTSNRYASILGT
ncbi:MAG: S41 family peptidase [Rhodothermales bacterium]|nr:S41 family peptidase [Rhodothermales bacterium]MBO6779097.1 S41 family peptidase [Rhodothermales bacterium]